MKRSLSLLLSVFLIASLISSAAISGIKISAAATLTESQINKDFFYTVSVSPTLLKVQSDSEASFNVKVARGSAEGIFYSVLSLVSNSPFLKPIQGMFSPPVLNFEQGQSSKNSTLLLGHLPEGVYKFKIKASAASRAGIDQVLSQVVTLTVIPRSNKDQKSLNANSLTTQGNDGTQKLNPEQVNNQQQQQQQNGPSSTSSLENQATGPNHAPLAKAGSDQTVIEGSQVLLDGSASSDHDKGSKISFLWEQISPALPKIKLVQGQKDSPKATFQAPSLERDTILTFRLTVKDDNGGKSLDLVRVLVKNANTPPEQGKQNNQGQGQEPQPIQIPSKNHKADETQNQLASATTPNGAEENTKGGITVTNHPPLANPSRISVATNKPYIISLQASDPDKGDKITFLRADGGPSHGIVAGFNKDTGSLTYIANSGFVGQDFIRFKVVDRNGAESNEATVTINVEKANIPSNLLSSNVTSSTSTNQSVSTLQSASPPISSSTSDKVLQRLAEIEAKLKETKGQKISNQYIVVLKNDSPLSRAQVLANDAKSNHGAKILDLYQKAIKGFTVSIPNRQALDAILNNSDVAYAEPDVKVKTFSQQILPTGIDRVDGDLSIAQSGDGKGDNVNADVAILDTGIDISHPDLNVYKEVTFVPGTTSANDDNGHGTMVAGIVGAKDNDFGVVGIAPGARLWAVKVLDNTGTGSLSSVIQGLDYVSSHANEIDVADMSFGCQDCASQALNTAISNAVAAGVTLVAAAGNEAKDASTFSPANHPDVIAVSAISDTDGTCGGKGGPGDDIFAGFSNYGSAIDLAAPGVNIQSTYKGGSYSSGTGTSMAAPHVAGAAALYKSENPNASPSQVLSALRDEGSKKSTICDPSAKDGRGYFTGGDKDGINEPLLHIKSVISSLPPSSTPSQSGVGNGINASDTSTSTSSSHNNGNNGNITNNNSGSASQNNIPTNNATTNMSPSPNPTNNSTNTQNNSNSTIIGNATDTGNGIGTDAGNATVNTGNMTGNLNNTQSGSNKTNGSVKITSGDTWYHQRVIGAGILNNPHGVVFDPVTGLVFVADTGNNRLVAFWPNGTLVAPFAINGFGATGPEDISVFPSPMSPNGRGLYVTDPANNNIDVYSTVAPFPLLFHNPVTYSPKGLSTGLMGGFLYVTDPAHKLVYSYTPTPPPLHGAPPFTSTSFVNLNDAACCLPDNTFGLQVYVTDNTAGVIRFDTVPPNTQRGTCCNTFTPAGIDVISNSPYRFIITDSSSGAVWSFDQAGNFISRVDSPGDVSSPHGVSTFLGTTNFVYIADAGNNRIQVYANSPPPNQAPVANDDKYSVFQDTGATTLAVGQNDTDPDLNTLCLSSFTDSPHGTTQGTVGQCGSITIDYTPDPGFVGIDTFQYTINDGQSPALSDTAQVTVNVTDNVAPTAPVLRFPPHGGSINDNTPTFDWDNSTDISPVHYNLTVDSSSQRVITALVDNSEYTATTPLADGNYDWRVTPFDSAGNGGIGFSSVDNFEVDTAAPAAPTITSPANLSLTQNNWVLIQGTAEAPGGNGFDTIHEIKIYDNVSGLVPIGNFTMDGSTFDNWSINVTGLSDAVHSFRATVTDKANNTSPFSDSTIVQVDANGPTVVSTDPQDNATGVSPDSNISATFSEPIDEATLTNTNFKLCCDQSEHTIPGSISLSTDGKTATLNPDSNLENVRHYAAFLQGGSTGIKDTSGNPLKFTFVFDFTTSNPPTIASTDPNDGAIDVSITPCVCATFSSQMNASTINSNTVELHKTNSSISIASQISYDSTNKIVSLNPSSPLEYSTEYLATIKGGIQGVKNENGTAQLSDFTWTFTTMDQPSSSGDNPFLGRWGSNGLGNSEFGSINPPSGGPFGVAIDSNNHDVYVTDRKGSDGQRIQKFGPDGTFLLKFGSLDPAWSSGQTPPDGMFSIGGPYDVAVNPNSGDVYVTDRNANRVQKFDSNGNFLLKWGSTGFGDGQFTGPTSIAVDSHGDVYVSESDANHRVQKFDANGVFIAKWGSQGAGDGQFGINSPTGIAFDSSGNVFVVDGGNARVQKFNPSGTFLLKADVGSAQSSWDIALDSSNNVYVSQKTTNNILKFSPNLSSAPTTIGEQGTGDGEFSSNQSPLGIAIAQDTNRIYAADFSNNRVEFFGLNATSDTTGPQSTLVLDNGEVSTTSPTVTANLTCSDADGSGCANVLLQIPDPGANVDPNKVDTATFHVNSTTDGVGKTFKAIETGVSTGFFVKNISLTSTPTSSTLGFTDGDQIGLTYSFAPTHGTKILGAVFEDHVPNTSAAVNDSISYDPGSCTPTPTGFVDNNGKGSSNTSSLSDYYFARKWGTSQLLHGNFRYPTDIVTDSNCNSYVMDSANNRIQKFSQDGTFIKEWGHQFFGAGGLAIDSQDNIYVADGGNHRIQKFDKDGNFLTQWGSLGSGDGQFAGAPTGAGPDGISIGKFAWCSCELLYAADTSNHRIQVFYTNGTFFTKWGTQGTGNNQFNQPRDVAVYSAGEGAVYVSDQGNERTLKYNATGNFIMKWGSSGSGNSQFTNNFGLAVDSASNVFTTEGHPNDRVQKFDSNGLFLTKWGGHGSIEDGLFDFPLDMSTDKSDNLYVADFLNDRIQIFNNAGTFLTKEGIFSFVDCCFGGPTGLVASPTAVSFDANRKVLYVNDHDNFRILKFGANGTQLGKLGDKAGSADGEFLPAGDSAVDLVSGKVYVTDTGNQRVQIFDSDGTFFSKFSVVRPGDTTTSVLGIALNPTNHTVYVTDITNNRTQEFASDGTFIRQWGTTGTVNGQFRHPNSVAVDNSGFVYVADTLNHRIQKFDSSGHFVTMWGVLGSTPGKFNQPTGVEIDSRGDVLVADAANERIQVFDSHGNFVNQFGSVGSNVGQFKGISDVAVDTSNDEVYTADGYNKRVQVFGAPPPKNASIVITSVNNSSPIWGVNSVGIAGNTSGFNSGDFVQVGWGDNSTSNRTIATNGLWNASHIYNSSAVGSRTVTAALFEAGGAVSKASTTAIPDIVVQKHTISISLRVPETIVSNLTFTAGGDAFDTSYGTSNPVPLSGAQISFNGSGATSSLASVKTQGVIFSVPSGVTGTMSISNCASCPSDKYDGTTGNKVLRMPENSVVSLPDNTYGFRATFDDMGTSPFDLEVVLANGTHVTYNGLQGGGGYLDKSYSVPASRVLIKSSPGVGYVGISSFRTSNFHGVPSDENVITFENLVPSPSVANPLVINGSSYYSVGRAPTAAPQTYHIQAFFAGNSSYDGVATAPVNYDTLARSPDQGTAGDSATFRADAPTTYNKPAEFSNLCANAYTFDSSGARVTLGDTDNDGVCDTWEPSSGTSALVTCPERSTDNSFIDSVAGDTVVDCNSTTSSFNLCITDAFADVWGNKAAGSTICPRKNHKDMFVEIDYMGSTFKPNPSAIKDVIMAFGNAPIINSAADDFGRTKGITLHVVVDEQLTPASGDPPIAVWSDTNTVGGDDFDSIKLGCPTCSPPTPAHFGTVAERGSADAARILDMKHYVYRYGIFARTWGSSCGPSGVAEVLGNDFLVTLGCGFTGAAGSREEQAGTLMHELGHTLGLGHGGPALDTPSPPFGSANYNMMCKPNYLSVMSYSRQIPTAALPAGKDTNSWDFVRDASGNPTTTNGISNTWPGTALDYSRVALPDLAESGLKETSGIPTTGNTNDKDAAGATLARAQKFLYMKGPTGSTLSSALTGTSIDWDANGQISPDTSPVIGDPNAIASSGCPAKAGDVEKSYSDWSAIQLKMLGSQNAQDGAGPDSPQSEPSRLQEVGHQFVQEVKQEAVDAGIAGPPDTAPPDTTIASATDGNGNNVPLNGLTSSSQISFSLSGSDNVAVSDYECSLDTAVYESCNTPFRLSGLLDGSHTVQIRAVDSSGNKDTTPASYTWRVDTTPPAKPTITSPANNTSTNNNKPPMSGTAEASSTVLIFDGTTQIGIAVTGPATATNTGSTWSFTPTTALAEGTHSITAKAKDAAGNIGPASSVLIITIDTVKPTVVSTIPANGATNVVVSSSVSGTFSEKINSATITSTTFTLSDGTSSIAGSRSVSADGKTVTFTPSSPLKFSTTYTGILTTGVKDLAGNALVADKTWTFSTQARTVVFNGVDQPINQDGSSIFKIASSVKTVIPVIFQLKDSSGTPVTDATVKFSAVKLSSTVTGTVNEQTTSGTPTSGDVAKFDTKLQRYVYYWGASASSATQGTWGIRLYLEAPYGSHSLLVGPNNVDNSVKLSLKS